MIGAFGSIVLAVLPESAFVNFEPCTFALTVFASFTKASEAFVTSSAFTNLVLNFCIPKNAI